MWRAAPVASEAGAVAAVARDGKARGARASTRIWCRKPVRGRTSSSVAASKTSSGRYVSTPMRAPARRLARRRHPHARGPMPGGDERQLGAARVQDAPQHQRAVDLLDAVLGEGAAQPLPALRLASPSTTCPRCPRRADAPRRCAARPRRPRAPRGSRAISAFSRVPVSSSRSGCTGMPAGLSTASQPGPCARTTSSASRLGDRALLLAAREGRDRDRRRARQARALLGFADPAPVQLDGAAREQAAHLRARERELLGEEEIETPSRVFAPARSASAWTRSRREGSRTLTAFGSTPPSGVPRSQSPRCRWRASSPNMSR